MPSPTPPDTPTPRIGVHVRVAGLTDVGLTREHNEDAFAWADLTTGAQHRTPGAHALDVGVRGMVFVVADGMGGAAAGELASDMAVKAVLDTFAQQWTPAFGMVPQEFAETLRDAADTANHRIYAYAGAHPEFQGMGTTATIAGLLGDTLYAAQVGDSRAYVVRDGEARMITKDQSLMQKLIEAGELTEEEAEVNDRRNIILQALGPDATVRADITAQKLRRGDTLVLCSDGLSVHLRAADIAAVVSAHDDPAEACAALIAAANAGGGHDNITAVVVRFEGEGLPLEQPERVGYHAFALPDSQATQLDRLKGRMRSGAVPAVKRPPLTPVTGVPATPRPAQPTPAAAAPVPRDATSAYVWVALFAIVVGVAWALYRFVL